MIGMERVVLGFEGDLFEDIFCLGWVGVLVIGDFGGFLLFKDDMDDRIDVVFISLVLFLFMKRLRDCIYFYFCFFL